ncbi:zinc finger, CCHC-type containing protein [Tanacetum coccineum]
MAIIAMSVVYVLTTPIPEDGENATVDQIRKRNKWDNDDYVCKGLILKGMFVPYLIFTKILNLPKNYGIPWRPNIWLRMHQVKSSLAVVRLLDPKLKTLGERGIECIFVGYAEKAFRNKGREAINDEMDSIMGNNTWVLADLPPGCKPLSWKWILKRKLKVDLKKEFLSSSFSMKDMGEADVILGIRIKHKSNRIAISHSYYIEKVLKKFNYFDCTRVSTLMDTSEKLMPNNGQAVSQLEYSRVIGCLMYAMICIRPDIAFVVGKLSRYTSNPGTQHWQAIQRLLKYLNKTMDYRLTYTGYPLVLENYTDESWISSTKDNSSTSGWVFRLGGSAGKEAEWLRNLILKIPFWSKPIAPISIRCDSAATLAKDYSQIYNGKSIHLGVRHNMIHELITNGVVSIKFVRSQ